MNCCDYDCNQGRNCPVRQTKYAPEKRMSVNREDIIRMAGHREVSPWIIKLVADAVAAEREACAKVCEDIYNDPKGNNGDDYYYTRPYLECAAAIRARSNT